MDMRGGKLLLAEITDEHVHDTTYLEKALKRTNRRKGKVLFDGTADSLRCYQVSNKRLLTPPKKGAIFREEAELEPRNDAIRIIRGLGHDQAAKSLWGK